MMATASSTSLYFMTMSLLVSATSAGVLEASAFVPYPGYAGNLSVAGTVLLLDAVDGQMMFFHLTGVDTACTAPTNDANSCGVHIHEGMTCETASDIGGHYWSSTFVADDPWATVVYATATGESTTMGAGITVGTGVSNSDNLGRAFVVHDSSGARVACATLASPAADSLLAAGFVPYAGYAGDYEVDGTVLIMTEGDTQTMYYSLSGVDTGCNSTPPNVANACGVHIHVGTNCSVAAGGHNWNTDTVTEDPWLSVTYDASAGTGLGFAQSVLTGLSASAVDAAVFVVHDSSGARIGCAEIEPLSTVTTVSTTGETAVSYSLGFSAPSLAWIAFVLPMLLRSR
mmetsp:Transcript_41905/g.96135  ORF Transcript_41905/g.96135 Transcript_41905/m.96135 type:complete len:343 (+) Transcript_41905:68-1096(+)